MEFAREFDDEPPNIPVDPLVFDHHPPPKPSILTAAYTSLPTTAMEFAKELIVPNVIGIVSPFLQYFAALIPAALYSYPPTYTSTLPCVVSGQVLLILVLLRIVSILNGPIFFEYR